MFSLCVFLCDVRVCVCIYIYIYIFSEQTDHISLRFAGHMFSVCVCTRYTTYIYLYDSFPSEHVMFPCVLWRVCRHVCNRSDVMGIIGIYNIHTHIFKEQPQCPCIQGAHDRTYIHTHACVHMQTHIHTYDTHTHIKKRLQ